MVKCHANLTFLISYRQRALPTTVSIGALETVCGELWGKQFHEHVHSIGVCISDNDTYGLTLRNGGKRMPIGTPMGKGVCRYT